MLRLENDRVLIIQFLAKIQGRKNSLFHKLGDDMSTVDTVVTMGLSLVGKCKPAHYGNDHVHCLWLVKFLVFPKSLSKTTICASRQVDSISCHVLLWPKDSSLVFVDRNSWLLGAHPGVMHIVATAPLVSFLLVCVQCCSCVRHAENLHPQTILCTQIPQEAPRSCNACFLTTNTSITAKPGA